MSSAKVTVALPGFNAQTETDPNNYIFHSDYNTLKILNTGTQDATVPANASNFVVAIPHGQPHIPFCKAFMREDALLKCTTVNNASDNGHIFMETLSVDYQNIYLAFTNSDNATGYLIHIRWYAFELPL